MKYRHFIGDVKKNEDTNERKIKYVVYTSTKYGKHFQYTNKVLFTNLRQTMVKETMHLTRWWQLQLT